MARIILKPQHVSASGTDNPQRTYHFQVADTIYESVARTLAGDYYGPTNVTPHGTLFRNEITCDQTEYSLWEVSVTYLRRPHDIGKFTWDLDGSGVTEHITHSIETIASYPTGTAPSFENAIGVEQDNVLGVDVLRPSARLTLSFVHPAGVVSLPYAKYLTALIGYVNSAAFFSFAAGEVRFSSIRTGDGTETEAAAIYTFDIYPNRTGITVGSITNVAKKGWEVSWVLNKSDTKTVSSVTYPVTVPQFVYIERVAPTIDFRTAFGFG